MAYVDDETGEVRALPEGKGADRRKRESKRERKDTTTVVVDVSKLIDQVGDKIDRAFVNGGAEGRQNYERVSKALENEREQHATTQKRLLAAYAVIEGAAAKNATLEVYKGKSDREMKALELQGEMYGRLERMAKEALPILAPHINRALGGARSGSEAATDGAQTGKAALVRLIVKLIDNPPALALVEEFAGVQDWSLIVQFVRDIGKEAEEKRMNAA